MSHTKLNRFALFAVCAFVFVSVAFAVETPATLKGCTVVDAVKAKSLMDSGAQVIDARVANEYVEAHIKGAKSVPYKEKSPKAVDFNSAEDNFDITKLPADKNAPIIFYCNGPECWKSYKASVLAIRAGHKKVFWLRSGIPDWKAKGFPIE
jgi:rhodanese-related sulfurtransferase